MSKQMKVSPKDLKEMERYIGLEFEGQVVQVNFVDGVDYKFDDCTARTRVYEIFLGSGKKIFGVSGGRPVRMRNYYEGFTDFKKVSDFHIYTIAKATGVYGEKELAQFAEVMEIPIEKR
ncbi:MAG: hypothetical protein UV40_C0001G0006 [Parcubacteria group bacterium GW2011_GWA1_42_7]|nr:MAG: hypothetical protein UV34_C0011G0006 [Parcubacteria group bacterium GW2011_GWB1_42_6]KKS70237.1 MAG: hypothetical protein UV40_C0001G0006 [Parcubacteria group bacterium GW2011_GWA1_42_7]KKS92588.1 MAG: hypothetical protein UV67_C0001G0028 [Parcubacteria group bacterium GW2011_GWC1_43_12]